MADTQISDAHAPIVLFKSKKRKLYRQRAAYPEADCSGTPILEAPLSPTSARSTPSLSIEEMESTYEDNDIPNMTEILRLRKLRKSRVGGVEFRAAKPTSVNTSQELIPATAAVEEKEEGGLNVVKRFVSQTGTSVEGVDKHMVAYIDSKLAERSNPTATNTSTSMFDKPRSDHNKNRSEQNNSAKSAPFQRETLSQGKIQEIDLVEDPRETARNRVVNKTPINAVQQQPKPRLGRNGKPYIPKNRNRRTSEELRRDALVDAVLTENTLGYYEQPKPSLRGGDVEAGQDEDADEAMHAMFIKRIEEESDEKRRHRPMAPPVQKSGYGQKEEEVLKGPKLGGSRMQRQAMREVLLKAEKDKGKK